jgi:hypothetical protein
VSVYRLTSIVVILTLGAAIVGKYHHVWHVYIAHYIFGHKKRQSQPISKAVDKGFNIAGWIQRKTWRTRSRLSIEYRDTIEFIKNPFFLVLDTERSRTSDHPTVKYSFAGSLPFPDEHERNNKTNYQGPWIKDDATWKKFNVEFFVEADDRTLKSWERYQRQVGPSGLGSSGEHIVYSVSLPPVPNYPDKRTVIATSDAPEIQEGVIEDPNRANYGAKMTNAIVPGARKASTVSFGLHTIVDSATSSTMASTKAVSLSGDSIKSPKKQGTFVIETSIPPSRMSSIHQPSTPTATSTPGMDPNVPPVPALHKPAEDIDISSQPESAQPPVLPSTNRAADEDNNEATAAARPLLARRGSDNSV